MKSNMKRFLGILLATMMVATMLPSVALADNKTEGSPNVFSIVADATGKQQTEYLLVDTLTQNGETYYGLMIRTSVHNWYPEKTLAVAGHNVTWVDDTTQTSTSTVVYKKLASMSGSTVQKTLGEYLEALYPASVVPYVATLEHKLSDYNGVTYKTVDRLTIPTWEILDANKEYVYLGGSDTHDYNGSITRGKPGWQGSGAWLKAMRPNYSSCYGYLGQSNYNYYWHPLAYVTKDFFKNIKIDTTKEIGANVKTLMSSFNSLDVANVGYTAEERELLGIGELPSPEGDTFVVDGITYYMVPNTVKEYKGETYVGVLDKRKYISWSYDADGGYLEFIDTKADGSIVGKLRKGVVNQTDIQGYVTNFEAFDGYLVDSDYEWSVGTVYMYPKESTATTKLYARGTIGLPSTTEYTALSANDATTFNNGSGFVTRSISHSGGTSYPHQWNNWKNNKSGNSTAGRITDDEGKLIAFNQGGQYNYWCFMTMVNVDFFLENKLDLATTSSNVRAFLANYSYADFSADYSKAEFDVLGITEFEEETKTEPGTSMKFTVGDKTYILMNKTSVIDGKTYYAVFYNKGELVYWNSKQEGGIATYIGERPQGGMYVDYRRGVETKTDIQTKYGPDFAVFADYMVGNDFEWDMGSIYLYGDKEAGATPIYYKGAICIPTQTELNGIYAKDSDIKVTGAGLWTRSMGTYGSNNNVRAWKPTETGRNQNASPVYDDENNIIGYSSPVNSSGGFYGAWSPMTYVSEDFFAENDIDLSATTGDGFKSFIVNNYSREDLTGWSKANLDILYGDYNGAGLGLTVSMTATGADVVIHNNGAEAAGAGATLIVASYDANGMVGVNTYVIHNNVSAGSKTSALSFKLNMNGATYVKAMLWEDVINAKPLTNVAIAN